MSSQLNSKNILFWLRRDLRWEDNVALTHAIEFSIKSQFSIAPIFIFDKYIISKLANKKNDLRVLFIYNQVLKLKTELNKFGKDLRVYFGDPQVIIPQLVQQWNVQKIYCNHDYDPYSRSRDKNISDWCKSVAIEFLSFKDQVIFEKNEILNNKGLPYTVFTPYKNAWLKKYHENIKISSHYQKLPDFISKFIPLAAEPMLPFEALGFVNDKPIIFPSYPFETQDFSNASTYAQIKNIQYQKAPMLTPALLKSIQTYDLTRNFPHIENGTSHLGIHLRFGTFSIRHMLNISISLNEVFISELIWREFFMQILWHFPRVVKSSFKKEYDSIEWRDSNDDFNRWSTGETGFPLIDAGIRELLSTGYMHNRVRMLVASFLTKNLLIHWHKGERFFSEYLLDYELAANNGNWQWAAGCGCDAAPYFRVFNPETQRLKFDPNDEYIKKWIPEYGTSKYPQPMVDLRHTHYRALKTYKEGIEKGRNLK